ncbi:MAG TPA: hypothetical protein VF746_15255 [Longimicrobium sp.]
MRALRLWSLAMLPLALAACGGGDADERGGEGDTTAAVAPMPTDTGAMVAPAPMGADTGAAAAGQNTIVVTLRPVNNSGISGEAVITAQESQAQVVLTLRGAQGAGTHQAHVHSGTCDSPGAPVAPLEPVTTDASGTGSSTTTIQPGMNALMGGGHIVSAHQAGGSPGPMVTCGLIEHQM